MSSQPFENPPREEKQASYRETIQSLYDPAVRRQIAKDAATTARIISQAIRNQQKPYRNDSTED